MGQTRHGLRRKSMKKRSAALGPLVGVALVWATATCAADAVPSANDADGASGSSGAAATGSATAGTGGAGGNATDDGATADSPATGGTAGSTSDGPGEADGATDAANSIGTSDAGAETPDGEDRGVKIISSTGVWFVFSEPYGDGGATNPIASTIMGRAEAFELSGGRMRISLTVTGLPPNRVFESRLHKLMCDTDSAGADYQNHPYPRDGSATDPAFSNSTNEAWIDFTTDANGAAYSETTVNWMPRPDQANAIIIHDLAPDANVGAPLACTNLPF
jgi:Cu-Zn family superoxide dismutase